MSGVNRKGPAFLLLVNVANVFNSLDISFLRFIIAKPFRFEKPL